MRVSVYGESAVLPSEDIRYALEWVCRDLLPLRCGDLSIRVVWTDTGADLARVFPVTVQTNKRFILQLNKRKIKTARTLYICLCHEAAHVWQFASNVLADHEGGKITQWWNLFHPANTFGYHEQPWEIEANIKEKELYKKLKAHLDEKAGRRRPRKSASQLSPRRHGEITRGRVWLNVVLFEDGYVKYVFPTKLDEEADRMIDEWTELGTVSIGVLPGSHVT